MPFKGDMRLGGPHDNERSLNGTSNEFNSYPPYGEVIEAGLTGTSTLLITESGETVSNGYYYYDRVHDGSGGETISITQYFYPTGGEQLGSAWGRVNYTAGYDGIQYPDGKWMEHVATANGSGYYNVSDVFGGDYFAEGTKVLDGPIGQSDPELIFSQEYDYGAGGEVWTGRNVVYGLTWNGFGGFLSDENGNYLVFGPHIMGSYWPDGTYAFDASDSSVEVPEGSGNYFFDGNDNRYEWDGNGQLVFRYSGLYPYGTYITEYNGNTYYWNGSGGFYMAAPSYGTPTGNTGTSGTYVDINGNQVQTGSYDWAEYYDGTGGTYQESSNTSYYSYGTYIYGDSSYNYYSDGMGSYYSEWYDSTGGGGGDGGGDGGGGGGECTAYGTSTGNTSSGTNYVDINGVQYENGTYSGTEFHDGTCGTYWEYSYSYQPYGYQFTSMSQEDENGNFYDVYYYSDGNGSYYTGT
jgi:hypothetical protein